MTFKDLQKVIESSQQLGQGLNQNQLVYNGTKEPKQALDEAAAKSAKVLGW